MRIALSSDEIYPINYFVLDLLKDFGHEVLLFGALASKKNESWVKTAKEAVNSMVLGQVDEAILFCWTGTGVAIATLKLEPLFAWMLRQLGLQEYGIMPIY